MSLNIKRNIASFYISEVNDCLSETELADGVIHNVVVSGIDSRSC